MQFEAELAMDLLAWEGGDGLAAFPLLRRAVEAWAPPQRRAAAVHANTNDITDASTGISIVAGQVAEASWLQVWLFGWQRVLQGAFALVGPV